MIVWQPGMSLDEIEKLIIQKAYTSIYNENKMQTALALGITVSTLRNKLERYEEEAKIQLQKDEQQRIADEKEQARHRGNPNNFDATTITGIRMEPTQENSAQPSLPVSERQEVQSVSPRQASGSGSNKHTRKV